MKKLLLYIALALTITLSSPCHGTEQAPRIWTSTAGTKLEAKLLRHDRATVRLERTDGSQLTVRLDQLSPADRDYLDELSEAKGQTSIEGIPAEPGSISPIIRCAHNTNWSYHLYLPKTFHDARTWPVWFILSPGGGKDGKALQRYIDGAEMLGCILALSVESRNDFADSDFAMEAMVRDVYSRVPVEKQLSFASGFSGGSRMAYLLAESNNNIQGVLACGSGSGVYIKEKDFRSAELRRSTYVYSLIGTNCFNRTEAYNSHEKFKDDYRLRYFPGKHEWAPSPLIKEGMARVLGEALKTSQDRALEKLRVQYARTLWAHTQALETDEPWEACYWAEFLAEFPAERTIQNDASNLAHTLKRTPEVQLARKAESAIRKFGKKYFQGVYYTDDKEPNEDRRNDAERIAAEFLTLPHGELIKRLGDHS